MESYTPQYVLRLQEMSWDCRCAGCGGVAPLTVVNWQQQQRHSALLCCDTAAAEICRPDAFILPPSGKTAEAALPTRALALNQGCIDLLTVMNQPLAIRLYALGIFLSRTEEMPEVALIERQSQELALLLAQGALAVAFNQLPEIASIKHRALRELGTMDLQPALDPLSGMALMLRLNELQTLSDAWLNDLTEQLSSGMTAEMLGGQPPSALLNLCLWRCYHGVFPGEDRHNWRDNYFALCRDYFNLRTLCGLLLLDRSPLDDQQASALCAALARRPLNTVAGQDPLLAGIALLR